MTENEAIEVMKANYPKCCKMVDGRLKGGFDDRDCDLGQSFTTGIKALEEIQQYKAIGSVGEFKNAMERLKPKMVIRYGITTHECPKCGQFLHDDQNFCQDCGTRLDWSEEDNKAKIEVGDIVYYAQTNEKAVVICKTVNGKKCKVMFDDFDIATLSYDELTQTGEQINLKEMLK